MCGIVGFAWHHPQQLQQATDRLAHRGPDAAGYWSNGQVSLGHRRLSIVDLNERSNQPFHLNHLHLSFNGEIYNFRQLKQQLAHRPFRTDSDTELVLHAYDEWGPSCVTRFEGMWALAIFDDQRGEFILSRDRFGIKPLYYSEAPLPFAFASELKALHVLYPSLDIDPLALNLFFYQKYIPQPYSIYQHLRKLPPGHNLRYRIGTHQLLIEDYFRPEWPRQAISIDQQREGLRGAVSERLMADVEVGSFLSGGLDSSVVAAMARQAQGDLQTFSIGFGQQSYNELSYAERVAQHIGSRHHAQVLDIDDTFIDQSLRFLDEPFGDASYIPTRLLSQVARQRLKVVLSGDAADEIFGGYDTYKAYLLSAFYPKRFHPILHRLAIALPEPNRKVSVVLKLKRFLRTYSAHPVERHFDWMATYTDPQRAQLLGDAFRPKTELLPQFAPLEYGLRDVQLADLLLYLPGDILHKVDMASMSNALEVRVPFLSPKVVQQALALPDGLKMNFVDRKIALKQIAQPLVPSFVGQRQKRGFTAPLRHWFRYSALLKEYLLSERYYQHGYFSPQLATLLHQRNAQRYDFGKELWLVFVFNYWYWHHHQPHA